MHVHNFISYAMLNTFLEKQVDSYVYSNTYLRKTNAAYIIV